MHVFILIGSLKLLVIIPQTTLCTAKLHTLSLFGTLVQVTVVWLVVVVRGNWTPAER